MTFGERLTQLRKENGYNTRNEFAEKLGIPNTTLRNYETGVREPGHTFLKQISELFNVSVDYLLCLTDDKEVLNSFRLRSYEQSMIEKYRDLDDHGQDMVEVVLEKEYDRCKDQNKTDKENPIEIQEKNEATKRVEELTYLPQYTASNEVKAARNDHINEEGELEKTLEDISNLKRPE